MNNALFIIVFVLVILIIPWNDVYGETLSIRVNANSDAYEEGSDGTIEPNSSDMELAYDGESMTDGLRFNVLTIPKGATIDSAFIQFTADETSTTGLPSLTIKGVDEDNSSTFTTVNSNISDRTTTTESVAWSPAAWTEGDAGDDQKTPDLKTIAQEIVDRSGWSSGNSMAFIITGTGTNFRTAENHIGEPTKAPLLTITFSIATSSSNSFGGGECNDCAPPTLGMTKGGLVRVVDDGFSYNNNPIDVQYFYTPYPLLTVEIGQENIVELKIYENSGASYLSHVGLSFGLGPQQIFGAGIVLIEWDRLFDGTEKVSVTDPYNLLENPVRVEVAPDLVKCTAFSATEQCTLMRIYHTFREAPEFQMLSTYVWDQKRNGWQNYYNHGIEVVGESLNPPDEYDGVNKGQIYHLTETDKGVAVDEFGNTWTLDKTWTKDYVKPERIVDSDRSVFTRMHSEFSEYKQDQINRAQMLLDQPCNDKIKDILLFLELESKSFRC